MPNEPAAPEFTLYMRASCQLCHEMKVALERHGRGRAFRISLVDVDGDPELEARFGDRVPVLTAGEIELCHYFLDAAAVDAHLDRIR